MAMASEQDCGEITSTVEGDPLLTFCWTTETEDHKLIPTSQGRQLCAIGYLPIAIAQIDPDDPFEFKLRALKGLSAELRSALEHKAGDLVRGALSGLAGKQQVTKAWQ